MKFDRNVFHAKLRLIVPAAHVELASWMWIWMGNFISTASLLSVDFFETLPLPSGVLMKKFKLHPCYQ